MGFGKGLTLFRMNLSFTDFILYAIDFMLINYVHQVANMKASGIRHTEYVGK